MGETPESVCEVAGNESAKPEYSKLVKGEYPLIQMKDGSVLVQRGEKSNNFYPVGCKDLLIKTVNLLFGEKVAIYIDTPRQPYQVRELIHA